MKRCYDCHKDMDVHQVVEGMKMLEKANKTGKEFEGWVHCMGPDDLFMNDNDHVILQAFKDAGLDDSINWGVGIVVCEDCVRRVYKQETGDDL